MEVCRPELVHHEHLIAEQESLQHLCEIRIISRQMASCRLLLKSLQMFRVQLPEPTREGDLLERFEDRAQAAQLDARKARGEGFEKPLPAMPEGYASQAQSHEHFLAQDVLHRVSGGVPSSASLMPDGRPGSSVTLGSRHEESGRAFPRSTHQVGPNASQQMEQLRASPPAPHPRGSLDS